MNIEKGVLFWDLEAGQVNLNFLYPREFNQTYYNVGGDAVNTQVSYNCNCGDFGEALEGSNYYITLDFRQDNNFWISSFQCKCMFGREFGSPAVLYQKPTRLFFQMLVSLTLTSFKLIKPIANILNCYKK
jgi:hypothetical protein